MCVFFVCFVFAREAMCEGKLYLNFLLSFCSRSFSFVCLFVHLLFLKEI